MSTQFIQCVGVQCAWSINDNCLTLENHPLGIVGILIPQIHPLKLIYPFISQRELNRTILLICTCMAQGPKLETALYYNHQILMKIVIWRGVQITCEQPIWIMAVAQLKMEPKFHPYCMQNHFMYCFIS